MYDSDAYNDDLPYWVKVPNARQTVRNTADGSSTGGGGGDGGGVPMVNHLVLPYSLCTNDSKFAPGRAFSTADDFFTFMKDAVDALLEEAEVTGKPKMMSVGLHPRLIGQ